MNTNHRNLTLVSKLFSVQKGEFVTVYMYHHWG